MWIGYQFGGASFLHNNQVRNFAPGQDGFPSGAVKNFIDREGVTWVITTRALARFDGGKWTIIGAGQGYRASQNIRFFMDRFHDLWITDRSRSMQKLAAHADTFTDTGLSPFGAIAFTPDGDGWASNDETLAFLHKGKDGALRALPVPELKRVAITFFDNQGDLWIGSMKDGVYRLPAVYAKHPGSIRQQWLDHFASRDGLSAGEIEHGLQDREGGVWFATDGGLDYFRRVPFHSISLPPRD